MNKELMAVSYLKTGRRDKKEANSIVRLAG
jgi:hypothetical protein